MLIRKLIYILFFVATNTIFAQTTLSIGANEELSIENGGILTINNTRFEPTATVSFSNTTISEATSTGNTAAITNINKVLVASSPINNYTGNITVKYTAAQLNGLSPTDLKVSFFDLIWNPSATSTVNVTAKTVQSSFSNITINEITLQATDSNSSSSSPTSSTNTSSGGGVSVNPDRDGDGIPNSLDAFPDDPIEWQDNDGDGLGDNQDPDDDNDGVSDLVEGLCFTDPKDPNDIPGDYDEDGILNCFDEDDDQDGYPDEDEIECGSDPLNELDKPLDTDNDLLANCVDPDDDNDTYLDEDDAFLLNDAEWLDTDGDGIGNNEDLDDDNDCYSDILETTYGSDSEDALSIPMDQDLDCIPDAIDDDDNNDGYPDDKILISTFFSPNSDGINDYFEIVNIQNFSNNEVSVFTRTGFNIFNAKNYQNNWAGIHNNIPLPEGSYYYRIDIDGNGSIDYEGWLYLTR